MRTTPVVPAQGLESSSQNPGGQNHSNLNLNDGPHVYVQPVVSNVHHGGNDYGLNFSNQNQSHYISLPSSSSYALHNVQFPPTSGVIPVDPALIRAPQKSPKKSRKRLAAEDSTLKQHIEAYERAQGIAPGAVELENRDLERKSPEVREKRTKQFRNLFCTPPPSALSAAFVLPRQQGKDDDQDMEPEVAEFKSSQKLFNPYGNGQPVADETMKKEEAVVRDKEDLAAQAELAESPFLANGDEEIEQDEQVAARATREGFNELTEFQFDSQTPKTTRKKKKSQATKARYRSQQKKNKRAEANMEQEDVPSTPRGRDIKSQRSDARIQQLSPYPPPSSTQPTRPRTPANALRPRSVGF